jgi:hypothetical protein
MPPPSMTIFGPVLFTIFAVSVSVMVSGAGPAVEGDHAAGSDRRHEGIAGAAGRGAVPTTVRGTGHAFRLGLRGHGGAAPPA